MTFRSATFLAAAALASLSAPAAAQNTPYDPGPPPPLPNLYEDDPVWDEDREDDRDAGVPIQAPAVQPPPYTASAQTQYAMNRPAMGYTPAQRAEWLAQCRINYDAASGQRSRAGFDACEDYLLRYERSFQGYSSAYPYPSVMWVKVPIVTDRRSDD